MKSNASSLRKCKNMCSYTGRKQQTGLCCYHGQAIFHNFRQFCDVSSTNLPSAQLSKSLILQDFISNVTIIKLLKAHAFRQLCCTFNFKNLFERSVFHANICFTNTTYISYRNEVIMEWDWNRAIL